MKPSRPALLYVGTLPPHPGGSAILAAGVLNGLAGKGWRIRCLAPIAEAAGASDDAFAARHPHLRSRRFAVPHYESAPNQPASEEYRRREGRLIQENLRDLVAAERPNAILIGRETFAWRPPVR